MNEPPETAGLPLKHLVHLERCASNPGAYPYTWRDSDATTCNCGLKEARALIVEAVNLHAEKTAPSTQAEIDAAPFRSGENHVDGPFQMPILLDTALAALRQWRNAAVNEQARAEQAEAQLTKAVKLLRKLVRADDRGEAKGFIAVEARVFLASLNGVETPKAEQDAPAEDRSHEQ